MNKMKKRIREAEERLVQLEKSFACLPQQEASVTIWNQGNRRNNTRIHGIMEEREKNDTIMYVIVHVSEDMDIHI